LAAFALVTAAPACAPDTAGLYGPEDSAATGGASSASSASSTASSTGAASGAGGAASGGAGASSGAGSGGSIEPCGAGSTAEFQDDFNDNSAGNEWAPYGNGAASIKETNQEIHGTTGGVLGNKAGYAWGGAARSLLGCHVSIEVKEVPPQDLALLTFFELLDGPGEGGKLSFGLLKGTLTLSHRVGTKIIVAFDAPYDAMAHRFWRFREAEGTVYFEGSTDTKTWQKLYSTVTPPFAGRVRVDFGIGAVGDAEPGGTVIFDNLNIDLP
jgi:hypothetical protein